MEKLKGLSFFTLFFGGFSTFACLWRGGRAARSWFRRISSVLLDGMFVGTADGGN